MRHLIHERAVWLSRNVLPHEPALRTMLRRWRVQEEDIDDLVQETYAKLTKLESVASVRNPKNYMFQTAYSLMISRIRRSQVVSIRAVSDLESVSAFDDTPTPEQSAEDRDELRAVLAALEQLPKACFRVFMLRRVDGLSQKEVASRLGLSENTVEHHMTSAIRFLMDHFGRGGKADSRASSKVELISPFENGKAGTKSKN